jgi:outer membrane biosynthesis protein TonB
MRQFILLACAACALDFAPARAADRVAGAAQEKEQSMLKLRADIVTNIRTPCGVKPTQRAEVKMLLQENGYLRSLTLVQSSGAPEFDAALFSAITDVQPFSLPKDVSARRDLLHLNLKFDAFSTAIPPCK